METIEVLDKVLKGKRLRPDSQRHYREALGSLARYSIEQGHSLHLSLA